MRKHLLIALCVAAPAAVARPAEEVPDSATHVLGEVEVTSSAAPKAATSTSPMRVVNHDAILRSGVTDVSDALHRMPGVNLRDYGGAGGLKTVSVRGFGSAHTGVFSDGVPLSDVQNGQIDLSRFSVDDVDRITMVIGDNDDIFIPARMAASAATVSLASAPLPHRRELKAKLRAGSFGYINPFLRIGTPVGCGAVNFVGEFVHADNDYPFTLRNGTLVTREKRTNSRMNSAHAEINGLWETIAGTLQAKVYGYTNSRQLPGQVIYYNNENHEHLREQNFLAQARWKSPLCRGLSLNGILKYSFASSLYQDENGKYPGGLLSQNYWQREYYTSWALLCTLLEPVILDYSADYFYNNLNSNLPTDRHPWRHSLLQTFTAKYRTERFTLMARALVSVYDNGAAAGDAAGDNSRISPSLSLSYQPMGSHLLFLRASYKDIFRMPTFNEAYFDHYGSTDVLPESTRQINLGATYTLRSSRPVPQATFTVDAYLNNIRQMIVAVPFNMFIWRMVNLGRVRACGVDATAEISFAPGREHQINLALNYSYQRAMPRTSPGSADWMKQVAYIPRSSGSLNLSYENPLVNLSATATGVSCRYATNENIPSTRIAGYIEVGATAWRSFPIAEHTLGLRLDALNILDKQYCIVARYPMPGRQLRITLSYTY